jgi:hypothetical protein
MAKKTFPIKFRTIHAITRWRKSSHQSIKNAKSGDRGAYALFAKKNKDINYEAENEPRFVIIWDSRNNDAGEILKFDTEQNELKAAEISRDDIEEFEKKGSPPPDEKLQNYFESEPNDAVPPAIPSRWAKDAVSGGNLEDLSQLNAELERELSVSRKLSDSARRDRLARTKPMPERIDVRTSIFKRNPDVIIEVLIRAAGNCEGCKQPAPFSRASDGSPYLEVHHRTLLSQGGEDTVANAIALCPNCHRRYHYGNEI